MPKRVSGRFARGTGLVLFAAPWLVAVPNWNTSRLEAVAASQRGDYAHAEVLLQGALRSLPDQRNGAAVILTNELGAVHHAQRRIDLARTEFEQALAVNQALAGSNAADSATSLNNLATLAGETGDPQRAETYLLRAANLLAKNEAGTARRPEALVHANLALTLQQMGRLHEAAPMYEKAAGELKIAFGEASAECARNSTNQAMLELQAGNYGRAIDIGRQALAWERALPYFSVRERALTLNNLGFAVSLYGDPAEAERLLREAITLEEQAPGNSRQLISSLENLAGLQERQGRLMDARAVADRASRLLAASRETDEIIRIGVWSMLGRLALAEYRTHEAREALERARDLSAALTGNERARHAAVLSNLAALESAERRHKSAEHLYRQAMEIDRSVLGEGHPEVSSDLSNLATQLVYLKRRKEAVEMYREALSGMRQHFGSRSVPVARTYRNIAVALLGSKQYDEAAHSYDKAFDALGGMTANQQLPMLAQWLHEYSAALRKTQRFGEAEAAETRALGMEVKTTLANSKKPAAYPNGTSGTI